MSYCKLGISTVTLEDFAARVMSSLGLLYAKYADSYPHSFTLCPRSAEAHQKCVLYIRGSFGHVRKLHILLPRFAARSVPKHISNYADTFAKCEAEK